MTRGFQRTAVLAGALALLGLAACGGSPPSALPTPPVPTAAPVPGPSQVSAGDTAEEQILARYRAFWTEVLPAAAAAKPEDRREVLADAMMEPALSTTLAWIVKLDRAGQKVYGHAVPVAQFVEQEGDTALAKGCLDSSRVGKADAETGKVLSQGLTREAVLVTLKRGGDGVWRVYGTYFPKDPRC
ncbi:MAG TPA: hypothetical protein VGP02_07655 [Mycobacteriales bacterium]|nr:hypothetical protein [Mycobacteriales bacterium]